MPGLCGYFAPASSDDLQKEWKGKMVSEHHRQRFFYQDAGFALGVIERKHGPEAGSFHESSRAVYGLYGHCFDPATGERLDAASFGRLWEESGRSLLDRLEGAFHFLALDRESRKLTILNDRIGILPFYWHRTDRHFSFGPRLRNLATGNAGWTPDPGAVVNFLSIGHFLGPTTQVREAKFLTPATILEIANPGLTLAQSRYWNLVYDPDHRTATADHCRRLGEAILESTSLLCPEDGGNPGIFLSGGWDSRALLGAMLKLDRPPCLVVANGASDEIRFSDTWLSKRMAKDLDLPFRFCRRVPDIGEKLWLDGVHAGEITTANNPESFGQHRLGPEMFAEIDYIVKGDVTWGSGDRAPTRDLAIGKILPYPLMDKTKALLTDGLANQADALYEEQIDGVMSHCENEDWTERRDYLWQMGGINRYILGLGISDEEHVQVRRPLLSGKVFDVYTKVPGNLRVLKNLFIQSIKEFYPDLFAYGRNHASNIAHYYAYMAPFVRQRTLAHLDAGHDLGGLLNLQACRRVIEAFAPKESGTYIPGRKRQLYNRFHDRFSHLHHRTRFYSEKHMKKFETSDTMLAFHIYLLLEWFHGSTEDIAGQ